MSIANTRNRGNCLFRLVPKHMPTLTLRGAALNKTISVMSICLAAAVIILVLACTAGNPPAFNTAYQAVLLDKGKLICKLSRLGTAFPEMTDVYYIVNKEDPETKTVKQILVKRGKELHAPAETFFDARHIVMIEPVGEDSEVAKLIAKSETQGSSQPPQPEK